MNKKKWIAAAAAAFLAMLVPAKRSNPPVTADFDGPPGVEALFRRSCYDCHSHETKWPWYARFGPGSWLAAYDVNEGRENLNFSAWGALDPDAKKHAAGEIWEEIAEGEMPLAPYLWLHGGARLTDEDKAAVRSWVESLGGTSGERP